MDDVILTKEQLAQRQQRSVESISTACSRHPHAVPRFFKLGTHKNSPIRFRLSDVIAWEERQVVLEQERIQQEHESRITW